MGSEWLHNVRTFSSLCFKFVKNPIESYITLLDRENYFWTVQNESIIPGGEGTETAEVCTLTVLLIQN